MARNEDSAGSTSIPSIPVRYPRSYLAAIIDRDDDGRRCRPIMAGPSPFNPIPRARNFVYHLTRDGESGTEIK